MTPRRARAIGWLLALVTVVGVCASSRDLGIARDEMVYFGAADKYADWWTGLVTFQHGVSRASITASWGGPQPTDNNREHPPVVKTLMGLSHRLLHDKLGLPELASYRFPQALLHGVLVLLVFWFVLDLWGLLEGVAAALLLMLLPRALFHASLACFDAPITTLWFATVYAYWRCLDGRRWPWQVGVLFGLALGTKHNALLLPFALGVHYLVAGYRQGQWRGLLAYRWRVIVSLAVVGPLTLVAVWPWLWFDTVAHVRQWITFHTTHVHYNFEYLGHNWNAPPFPWHVALVTTLYTVPVATLVAAVIGAVVWVRSRGDVAVTLAGRPATGHYPGLLLGLSAVASIAPFFLGSTPIFGAEKHWMPALPSICIAAGVGTAWAARTLAHELGGRARMAVLAGVVAVVALAATVEVVASHPYALTWYNALAGEDAGGADRGMNRQFWGVAARGVLPVLASAAPGPAVAPVYSHDASPAWNYYAKLGLRAPNLPDAGNEQAGIDRSQLAIVIHERHFNRHDFMVWAAYGTVQPIFVLRAHGVPIVSVYQRPAPRPTPVTSTVPSPVAAPAP